MFGKHNSYQQCQDISSLHYRLGLEYRFYLCQLTCNQLGSLGKPKRFGCH